MKKDQPFVQHILETLAPLGEMTAKSMFGGWSIYADGLTIAVVADGILYFKGGPGNIPDFEAAGLDQFRFETDRGVMKMAYYKAPESALERPAALLPWARGAQREAVAAAGKKKPRAKKVAAKKSTRPAK